MFLTRRVAMAAAILLATASLATAGTLHSSCADCTDGSVTKTMTNPPTFSFTDASNKDKGDFWLVALIPDNKNAGFSLTMNGVNTQLGSVAGNLFSATEWNSGKLDAYLSSAFSSFNPPSPLSAYLPSTQGVDAGASGYFVYLFDFGAFNYKTEPAPIFSEGSGAIPGGSLFLALLTDAGTHKVNTATPQSSALLIDVKDPNPPPPPPPVPEPGSLALFGSGLIGIAGAMRRKLK